MKITRTLIAVVVFVHLGIGVVSCFMWIPWELIKYIMFPTTFVHFLMSWLLKLINEYKNPDTRFSWLPFIATALASACNVIIYISIINSTCIDIYCSNINNILFRWIILFFIEYLHICLYIDILYYLTKPGTRLFVYRLFVNWPASIHFTILFISLFILPLYPILSYYYTYPCLIIYLLLFILSLYGIYISLFTKWSYISIIKPLHIQNTNNNNNNSKPERWNDIVYTENESNSRNTLKLCQITDCHLGAFCSIQRLQSLCNDIISKNPDIIILTGDYFTGEAHCDNFLYFGLKPLQKVSSKCFACLGNHDMENDIILKRTIKELRLLGIRLLRNESVVYNSRIGKIQIIGYDYLYLSDNRYKIINDMMNSNPCPKECNNKRIVLLHDPGSFKYFNDDENVIVFSGHTHGGHVGIINCFGITKTMIGLIDVPDNGGWVKGNNLLYVHRGQGSRALYGNLLLRIGIPTEQSCLSICWSASN